MGQIMVGMNRSSIVAYLADRSLIKEQAVPLLAGIGLAGAWLGTPGARIAHFIFLHWWSPTVTFSFILILCFGSAAATEI